MGKRGLTILSIILAQIGCLASGFWIHHQFTTASISRSAHQQGWADLDARTEGLLANLKSLAALKGMTPDRPNDDLKIDPSVLQAFEQHSQSYPEQAGDQFFLVNSEWKVLAKQEDDIDISPLEWNPLNASTPNGRLPFSAAAETPMRGFLESPHGHRLAMAYPLKNFQGYLVAAREADSMTIQLSAVSSSQLQSALIAFVWTAIILAFAAYLIVARLFDWFDTKHNQSETESMRHAEIVSRTRDAVIFGLAKLTESRDPETGGHLERIALYSSKLAQALRIHPKFRHIVTSEFVRLIDISSSLHDIGKVGIEDTILLKPGPLTHEERKKMQKHAAIGGKCIQDIEQRLGSSNFLQMAREIAFAHHEKWDGSGYPQGLKGEEIPLAARVVALVDVYEALTSKRVYKKPMSHSDSVAFLKKGAGKHFDPDMVEAFMQIEAEFHSISTQLAESTPSEGEIEDLFAREAITQEAGEAKLVGAGQAS